MTKAMIICVAASILLLGCGVDEEPLRPRAGQGRTNLAAMSLEERIAATEGQDAKAAENFVRADGSSGGDVEADYRACRIAKLEDRAFLNANGIKRALMLAKCMEQKGWAVKKGATSNGGS